MERTTDELFIYDRRLRRIVRKETTHTPALLQIVDEILVNAADNQHREPAMSVLHVQIGKSGEIGGIGGDSQGIGGAAGKGKGKGTGTGKEPLVLSVGNDGAAIPVQVHGKHGVYVPELVFGHLLTSSNYDDSVARYTGGRHGFGAKLTNIFSTRFDVQVYDARADLLFEQTYNDNMATRSEPKITEGTPPWPFPHGSPTYPDGSPRSWTRITFTPDFDQFGGPSALSRDLIGLVHRRAFDLAMSVSSRGVAVVLNDKEVPVKSPADYVKLLPDTFAKVVSCEPNKHWHVAVGVPKDTSTASGGHHVSFVNGIHTARGGTHVQAVLDQVARHVADHVNRQDKDFAVLPFHVKHRLSVFVNAEVQNPSFDSQTKDSLITPVKELGRGLDGGELVLPRAFLNRVVKETGISEVMTAWAKRRQKSELVRTSRKKRSAKGKLDVPKLDDANWAGTSRAQECTLILTEGDSAKALAVSGLSVLGRDRYGVFPLKGKLLNVRDASHKQIVNNAEMDNLRTILGLEHGKSYKTKEARKHLRYGRVMLMTDQDADGSHIKGLFINMLHHFWPSLLEANDFLEQFVTAIVKGTKGKEEVVFYSIPEYEQWRDALAPEEAARWRIKYYKGLGTNTAAEAKAYFSNLDKQRVRFVWDDDDACAERIVLAFSKDEAQHRKTWLRAFDPRDPTRYIDSRETQMTYRDFVDKELIRFSHADNLRSIPSAIDGFKPGQRKVMYACFKRDLRREIKVAQLAGFVSEHTAYHHGEASLHGTIVNMAQDYVGSNNLPLLDPVGQFGTRHLGGKDAASPRYIFTRLRETARLVFPAADDALLEPKDEDGMLVEPEYYAPVLPIVLCNGAEGVGTGFSTYVPRYDVQHVIENVRRRIRGEELEAMVPSTRGFVGSVTPASGRPGVYVSEGVVKRKNTTRVEVSELPIGRWTQDYKEFLTSLIPSTKTYNEATANRYVQIKGFSEHHTDGNVRFEVNVSREQLAKAEKRGLSKAFKLYTSLSENNMHLFNAEGHLVKYDSPLQVIDDFFSVRKDLYGKRKAHQLDDMQRRLREMQRRQRFTELVVGGQVRLLGTPKAEVEQELRRHGLEEDAERLLRLPLHSVTHEQVAELRAKGERMHKEVERLERTAPEQLWLDDLDALEAHVAKRE